jgi:hypothetical protein
MMLLELLGFTEEQRKDIGLSTYVNYLADPINGRLYCPICAYGWTENDVYQYSTNEVTGKPYTISIFPLHSNICVYYNLALLGFT